MKILVVGGGPAGLFFARLMKRQFPDLDITVCEQNPNGATYGFGVTLAGAARDRLRLIDEAVHDRLAANMVFNRRQDIKLDDEAVPLEYASSGGAIARLTLLSILEDACREVGVKLVHDQRIPGLEETGGYDLVVASDGSNSALRAALSKRLGTTTHTLENRFAWYGVKKIFEPNALVFRHRDGGRYVAHYYAYSADMSTFVAECDGDTWNQQGFGALSDQERKRRIEDIFGPELEGASLIENKSIWRQFSYALIKNWHDRNVVVIGDALRPAHFSIGSGTRLAMDDAHALFEALRDGNCDIQTALPMFEARRRPVRDLFTEATIKSYTWYENIREEMAADPLTFTYRFLARTGRVNDQRMKSMVPDFFARYESRCAKGDASPAIP